MTTKANKILSDLVGPTTFAMLLRAYMTREDISQSELARRLDVTRGYISNIMNGKKVTLAKAIEVAETLGESVRLYAEVSIKEELRESGYEADIQIDKFIASA